MSTATTEGNLTRDPELRYTPSGKPVVTLGIAENRRFTDNSGAEKEITNFYDVEAWGSLAENISESLNKGDRVVVTGRLKQDTWQNEDGSNRSKVVIVADSVGVSLRWASVTSIVKNNGGMVATTVEDGEEPF